MNAKLIHKIAGLRLAVGFLGEQEQAAWWPSVFLGRHAHAFLNPIFGSKTRIAQYHGITEAACRVHDESIGVGRVFHLFRLIACAISISRFSWGEWHTSARSTTGAPLFGSTAPASTGKPAHGANALVATG